MVGLLVQYLPPFGTVIVFVINVKWFAALVNHFTLMGLNMPRTQLVLDLKDLGTDFARLSQLTSGEQSA